MRLLTITAIAAAALLLSACTRVETLLKQGTGYGTSQDRLTRKVGEPRGADGKRSKVNAYLWTAALDTIGTVPLVESDPRKGVILTDWYSAPATANERTQMRIEVLDADLEAKALRVSIARQIAQEGQWIAAHAPTGSAQILEDLILTKARDNRR